MSSSLQIDEEELKKFTDTCTGICATLFFFMVILNPAIPEESGEGPYGLGCCACM